MIIYTPTGLFSPSDRFTFSRLSPTHLRALYAICLQAQQGQQTAPDEFFDSKEISADAASLAAVCLSLLTRLSTDSVDNAPDLTAEG